MVGGNKILFTTKEKGIENLDSLEKFHIYIYILEQ
jgi:hypothetical protein